MTLVGRGLGRGGYGAVVAGGLTIRPLEIFPDPVIDPEVCILAFNRRLISLSLTSTIDSTNMERKVCLISDLIKTFDHTHLQQTPRNYTIKVRYKVTETEID